MKFIKKLIYKNYRPKIWNNLLRNRCPKCGKNLWFDKDEPYVMCNSLICGFMIDQARMQEIIMKITNRKLEWDKELEGQGGELSTGGYL